MSDNVVRLSYNDDNHSAEGITDFMEEISDFCEAYDVDTSTTEYKHQAAIIMTQLQIILMGANK